MEKVKFNHNEENTMKALNCTQERMDDIVREATINMKKKYPQGNYTHMLDLMIQECTSVNEIVAATVNWKTIVEQIKAAQQFRAVEKNNFKKKLGLQ